MTVSELLDRAAMLASKAKRVVIVTSGPSQREVMRSGLRRRLDAPTLELVALVTSVTDGMTKTFDVLLVTDDARKRSQPADRALLEATVADSP